jgi:hypothetical protein
MELKPHLDEGERLIWAGRPAQGIQFRRADVFLIPFSLLWSGFAFFWEYSVLLHGPSFFVLWGIPFCLIGVYITIGRFFVDATARSRTCYAITDERILIIEGILRRNVRTLPLKNLSEIALENGGGETGTIRFATPPFAQGWTYNSSWPGSQRDAVPHFDMIEDAKKVYSLIRAAQKPFTGRSSSRRGQIF